MMYACEMSWIRLLLFVQTGILIIRSKMFPNYWIVYEKAYLQYIYRNEKLWKLHEQLSKTLKRKQQNSDSDFIMNERIVVML